MAHSEIILTENIESLGAEADIVSVPRGYARNFLIPRGKALEVTSSSLRRLNHLKAQRAEREARELAVAEELGDKISKLKLTFVLETGESGKAFGSVTAKDIIDKILNELPSISIPKHAVSLEKPIKETGTHKIDMRLHSDVLVQLTVSVKCLNASEEKQTPTESPAGKKSRKKSVNL